MRRQLFIGALVIAAAIAIGSLLIWSRPEPQKTEEQKLAPLVEVADVELRSGRLRIRGSGTVQAREEVSLAAEVPGKLVYVNPSLRAGQKIRQGAVLFRIDAVDYRNAVRSANAEIAARQVDVLQAREEMTIARAELEQFQKRAGKGGTTSIYTGIDENDYAARILPPEALGKKSDTGKADAPVSQQTNRLATREPQLQSARAAFQRAQAQLADANIALNRTTVRSPFNGIVRSEQIAKGSYVAPGQTLGSIVNSDGFEAVIPLSEREAALIPSLFTGGRIEASAFLNYGGKRYRWQAFVDRASKVVNPQTRTIDVFLNIPNPLRGGAPAAIAGGGQDDGALASNAPPLLVGSFVEVEIDGAQLGEYAAIPLSALRPGNQVWLVENGQIKIVSVQILQRGDTEVLIRSENLGSGSKVVTGGLSTATVGQQVRIVKEPDKKAAAKTRKATSNP